MVCCSNQLPDLADLVKFNYLPVVTCQSYIGVIVASDCQSVGRIQDDILTAFNNFFLFFYAYLAVNFLYTYCESELRRLFLGNLSTQKWDIFA